MKKSIIATALFIFLVVLGQVHAWNYGDPAIPPDTKYEKFGPRCDNLLIKLYATHADVITALGLGNEIDIADGDITSAERTFLESANTGLMYLPYNPGPPAEKAASRKYVGSEPAYTGRFWRDFVNMPSDGVDNYWTFLNMRPTRVSRGGTIRYGFEAPVLESLNPLYATSALDNKVLDLIGYESLVKKYPYDDSTIEWLCDRYDVGTYDDGAGLKTNITFQLRSDAYWSDGSRITIDDVEYTFMGIPQDLAARGFPPPIWFGNVEDVVYVLRHSSTTFEVRLDILDPQALDKIGLNRILPKHIWEPICKGYQRPKDFTAWDPTTFAPDPDLIHSGPWCLRDYDPANYILLQAHKRGAVYNTGITTDPNKDADDITSPQGFFRYYRPEDINKDDKVSILDFIQLANAFGATEGDPRYNRAIDINGDGHINILDAIAGTNVFWWPILESTE